MPFQFPPPGTPAWDRYIEQALKQHRVDIQRLWNVIPQVPDPHAGVPHTGPMSPTLMPSVASSRSSPAGGSSGSSSGP